MRVGGREGERMRRVKWEGDESGRVKNVKRVGGRGE